MDIINSIHGVFFLSWLDVLGRLMEWNSLNTVVISSRDVDCLMRCCKVYTLTFVWFFSDIIFIFSKKWEQQIMNTHKILLKSCNVYGTLLQIDDWTCMDSLSLQVQGCVHQCFLSGYLMDIHAVMSRHIWTFKIYVHTPMDI